MSNRLKIFRCNIFRWLERLAELSSQTDSLLTVRYPGLTIEIRKPASGGDMAERVTVTYPRNLTYAEPGIGARETRVVELLGEPTTRETGRLTYECGTGPAPPRVTFVIENAAVSEVVFELLAAAAEAEGIPYTIEAASRDTRTDAEAIYNAHRGVATALVSVPNRYMHSPNEMISLEDLDRTARLLAAFARRLSSDTDFVPR